MIVLESSSDIPLLWISCYSANILEIVTMHWQYLDHAEQYFLRASVIQSRDGGNYRSNLQRCAMLIKSPRLKKHTITSLIFLTRYNADCYCMLSVDKRLTCITKLVAGKQPRGTMKIDQELTQSSFFQCGIYIQ